MKIAILDTYYPAFLKSVYLRNDGLDNRTYDEQLKVLFDECFGTSDFYSRHLKELGCEAIDLVANSIPLAYSWVCENDYKISKWQLGIDPRITRLPYVGSWFTRVPGLVRVVVEQVRQIKPDILYCQNISYLHPNVLRELNSCVKLIVGQIASAMPPDHYLVSYDLILTSFPHFVRRFRDKGLSAEYFRIGFDTHIIEKLGSIEKDLGVTFVGGISAAHSQGTALLEFLAGATDIDFFGYGRELLPKNSKIRSRHHGEVWGLDMYRALVRSRITVNRHIDVAENYANNMRLYEATGVGAMLITDRKDNLSELFDIGREVEVYSSPEEAAELINYYMAHPLEAGVVARAGQDRTLKEHTYQQRMVELVSILERYLP